MTLRHTVSLLLTFFVTTLLVAVTGVGPALADSSVTEDPAGTPASATAEPTEQAIDGLDGAAEQQADEATDPVVPSTTAESPTPEVAEDPAPVEATTGDAGPSPQRSSLTQQATAAFGFQSPASGSVVPAGQLSWSLQITVPQTYTVDLSCDDAWLDQATVAGSSSGEVLQGTFYDLPASASCVLDAWGDDGSHTSTTFSTAAPLPEVRRLTVSPATFYPHVRDGFRDRSRLAFTTRLDSTVRVQVRNSEGRTVWSKRLTTRDAQRYERRSVAWNGRTASGAVAPVGRYLAVVSSTLDGRTGTDRIRVEVATGTRSVDVTRRKDGWFGSRDTTRGSCYASETFYPHGNQLDCWGGAFARATYRFHLPTSAKNVRWGVRGYQMCCDTGRITKTGDRTSARSYRVQVQVTEWRAYVVRKVWISYTYRRAI